MHLFFSSHTRFPTILFQRVKLIMAAPRDVHYYIILLFGGCATRCCKVDWQHIQVLSGSGHAGGGKCVLAIKRCWWLCLCEQCLSTRSILICAPGCVAITLMPVQTFSAFFMPLITFWWLFGFNQLLLQLATQQILHIISLFFLFRCQLSKCCQTGFSALLLPPISHHRTPSIHFTDDDMNSVAATLSSLYAAFQTWLYSF